MAAMTLPWHTHKHSLPPLTTTALLQFHPVTTTFSLRSHAHAHIPTLAFALHLPTHPLQSTSSQRTLLIFIHPHSHAHLYYHLSYIIINAHGPPIPNSSTTRARLISRYHTTLKIQPSHDSGPFCNSSLAYHQLPQPS